MFVEQNNLSKLLQCRGTDQKEFHARAAGAALEQFGPGVFIRAVVEVSNYCRENCSYCGMRRDNRSLKRLRAGHDEIAELVIHHRPASITDLNIQTGEDPVVAREVVIPLIQTLKRETNLGISVCLGTLSPSLYTELRSAGASIYIMKFEMADRNRYSDFNAPGTLEERLESIRHLAANGWRVSSGFIAGLPGQTTADMLRNLTLAGELPLSGCSVSPFIPGDETPLMGEAMADINLTLNCMTALRLMRRNWVIPAVSALNLASPGDGYRRGLETGANLVTINMTPDGIRENYLLYKRDRFIMTEERILEAIAAARREPSDESLARFYERQPGVQAAGVDPVNSCAAA